MQTDRGWEEEQDKMTRKEERIPLKPGQIIMVGGYIVEIYEYLGAGTSCLVYEAGVRSYGEVTARTVIVKEFYPEQDPDAGVFPSWQDDDALTERIEEEAGTVSHTWQWGPWLYREEETPWEIWREEEKLRVSPKTQLSDAYSRKLEQFRQGYEFQSRLASSQAMEIMVRPYLYGEYGDTYYLLSDVHMGQSLDRVTFDTLEDKCNVVVRIAELLQILHENHYLFMDFKPENILWIDKPEGVRLFDVDSVVDVRETSMAALHTLRFNERYLPEEMTLFQNRVLGGSDMEREKIMLLTPQVNIYQLGVYFFELLFNRTPRKDDLLWGPDLQEELCQRYLQEVNQEELLESLMIVLKKMLNGRVSRRYPTAKLLLEDLKKCQEMMVAGRYMEQLPGYLTKAGTDEQGLSWRLRGTTLIISGRGRMMRTYDRVSALDSQWDQEYCYPWTQYRNIVEEVIIHPGVENVGEYAFQGFGELQTVTLPDTIRWIDCNAFENCMRLKELQVPERVVWIGMWALSGCGSLVKLTLPRGIRYVCDHAWDRCISLRQVEVPPGTILLGEQ